MPRKQSSWEHNNKWWDYTEDSRSWKEADWSSASDATPKLPVSSRQGGTTTMEEEGIFDSTSQQTGVVGVVLLLLRQVSARHEEILEILDRGKVDHREERMSGVDNEKESREQRNDLEQDCEFPGDEREDREQKGYLPYRGGKTAMAWKVSEKARDDWEDV